MKKRILILLLLIIIPLLNSCFKGELIKDMIKKRLDMLNDSNDEKKAAYRLEQILEVIKKKDNDALKAIFSKQALREANDIYNQINYLFDFFQGKVLSWERYSGPVTYEEINHGYKVKELISFFNVETDKQKYVIFLLEYTVDTKYPENVGLYTLRVIKVEDKKTQWGYWQDMKMPGIYRPTISK